jgi:hypothetical protein
MENTGLVNRVLIVNEKSDGSAGNAYLLTNDEAATWDTAVLCATAMKSQ